MESNTSAIFIIAQFLISVFLKFLLYLKNGYLTASFFVVLAA